MFPSHPPGTHIIANSNMLGIHTIYKTFTHDWFLKSNPRACITLSIHSPIPNGITWLVFTNFPSPSRNLWGSNFSGSGKIPGSLWTECRLPCIIASLANGTKTKKTGFNMDLAHVWQSKSGLSGRTGCGKYYIWHIVINIMCSCWSICYKCVLVLKDVKKVWKIDTSNLSNDRTVNRMPG